MTDVISPQVTYKKVVQHAPRYKYVRINMSNILSNQVTVSATNSVEVHFKLPYNTVMNLSRSRFNCSLKLDDQGNGAYSSMIADAWPFFGNVSVETGNGIQMLNLTNSSKYTKILNKVNTKFKDFVTRDTTDLMYPCNSTTNATITLGGTAQSVAYLESKYYNKLVGDGAGAGDNDIDVSYALGN